MDELIDILAVLISLVHILVPIFLALGFFMGSTRNLIGMNKFLWIAFSFAFGVSLLFFLLLYFELISGSGSVLRGGLRGLEQVEQVRLFTYSFRSVFGSFPDMLEAILSFISFILYHAWSIFGIWLFSFMTAMKVQQDDTIEDEDKRTVIAKLMRGPAVLTARIPPFRMP